MPPKKKKVKVKVMKPVDTSKPNGEHQFKPTDNDKKKLKKKDIFEIKSKKKY
tara:strand:- start:4636 stop:4791 length:156 start_codon:yes stop_codon:yes gene_type:complete